MKSTPGFELAEVTIELRRQLQSEAGSCMRRSPLLCFLFSPLDVACVCPDGVRLLEQSTESFAYVASGIVARASAHACVAPLSTRLRPSTFHVSSATRVRDPVR